MKKIFVIMMAFLYTLPLYAFAESNAETGLVKPTKSYGLVATTDGSSLLQGVTSRILEVIAALAVLMIVVSGIMYITSAGDSGRVDKAKGLLVASVTGLVIVILAYAIVRIVSLGLGAQ